MPRTSGPALLAPRTVALVLAAGAGSRLGGVPKCLIRLNGTTLLQHLLQALQGLEVDEVRLVYGHHAEALAAHINTLPTALWPVGVHNPDPGDDPAGSLHAGLDSLSTMPDRVLVLLGDQPLLRTADLQAVLDAFDQRAPGQHALVPVVGGQPGHPVVLDRQACAALRAQAHGGFRAWRAEHPQAVHLWANGNARYVRDIDLPEDLVALQRDTGLPVDLPGGPCGAPECRTPVA